MLMIVGYKSNKFYQVLVFNFLIFLFFLCFLLCKNTVFLCFFFCVYVYCVFVFVFVFYVKAMCFCFCVFVFLFIDGSAQEYKWMKHCLKEYNCENECDDIIKKSVVCHGIFWISLLFQFDSTLDGILCLRFHHFYKPQNLVFAQQKYRSC